MLLGQKKLLLHHRSTGRDNTRILRCKIKRGKEGMKKNERSFLVNVMWSLIASHSVYKTYKNAF